jgi:hypothetical protein
VRVRYVSVGPGSCGTRPAYGVRPYDAPILLDRVPASVRHSTRGQFRGRAEREPTRPCGGEFFNPHPPQCRYLITEGNGASHTTSVACPTHGTLRSPPDGNDSSRCGQGHQQGRQEQQRTARVRERVQGDEPPPDPPGRLPAVRLRHETPPGRAGARSAVSAAVVRAGHDVLRRVARER